MALVIKSYERVSTIIADRDCSTASIRWRAVSRYANRTSNGTRSPIVDQRVWEELPMVFGGAHANDCTHPDTTDIANFG